MKDYLLKPVSAAPDKNSKKTEQNSSFSFLREQWYRFFIDADLLAKEDGYSLYDEREPGAVASGQKAISAVLDIMDNPPNEKVYTPVSAESIKAIHSMVKGHQEEAGIYRNHPTGLFLVFEKKQLQRVDRAGAETLKEFIPGQWPGACVSLVRYDDITYESYLTPAVQEIKPSTDGQLNAFFSKDAGVREADTLFYRAPNSDSISALISASCDKYNQTMQALRNTYQYFMSKATYKAPEIIDEFQQNWQRERLRAIVQFAKEVDLIHPFTDGNTRTALLLIQQELVRHNYLPAIIADPNTLEVLTIDEFIDQQLVPGIAYTEILSKNPSASICGYRHPIQEAKVSSLSILKSKPGNNIIKSDDLDWSNKYTNT